MIKLLLNLLMTFFTNIGINLAAESVLARMRVSRVFIVYRALIGYPCSSRGERTAYVVVFTFAWKDSLVFSQPFVKLIFSLLN